MAYSVYLVEMKAKDIHTGEVRRRSFAVSAASESGARDKGYARMHTLYPRGNYSVTVERVERKNAA